MTRPLLLLVPAWIALAPALAAEAPEAGSRVESPIEDAAYGAALLKGLQKIATAGRPFTRDDLQAAVHRRLPGPGDLPAPRERPLEDGALHRSATRATLALFSATEKDARAGTSATLGTAFVIHRSGIAVTCLHALRFAEPFVLAAGTADGRVVGVRAILSAHPRHDLVFLQLEGDAFEPLPLRGNAPAGSRVYAMGMPLGIHFFMVEGLLARYDAIRDGVKRTGTVPRMNVSLESASGFSGGPVFDAAGNALGMLESKRQVTRGAENYTIHSAIPGAIIRRCFTGECGETLSEDEIRQALDPATHRKEERREVTTFRTRCPEGEIITTRDNAALSTKVTDPTGRVIAEGAPSPAFRAKLPAWAQRPYDENLAQASRPASGPSSDRVVRKQVETRSPQGAVVATIEGGKITMKVTEVGGRVVAEGEPGDAFRARLPAWAQPVYDTNLSVARRDMGVRP